MDEKQNKIDLLAREILILSRNTLLVNLRFLDVALSTFKYISNSENKFSTDGEHFFYNSPHILDQYNIEKEIPVRDYLHIVLHCIFHHMFIVSNINKDLWDLSCDISAEATINELDIEAARASREKKQIPVINKLKERLGNLTAEKIYSFYLDEDISNEQINNLQYIFSPDNHEIWYKNKESMSEELISKRIKTWQQISKRMQTELENFSKKWGYDDNSLMQNLKMVNREKYDYKEFLRKFAVRGEEMGISEDEFDYIYYTYGLRLYERMPLIEPLEYKEAKKIREFVIAIDTSGSVSGEEVQSFIQKTYNILKNSESFFSKINLHIIQCDTKIQEHVKITSQNEFDKYIDTMKIHGLGGTDFRPVFLKINEMINEKEFINLKGLLYFTDGYGTFPNNKPDYDTAFIFLNDNYFVPEVPAWAIKLILKRCDIS